MAQGKKLSRQTVDAFLYALSHTGHMKLACAETKVGLTVIYDLRNSDPEFEARFQKAIADFRRLGSTLVESEAMRIAIEGTYEYVTTGKGLVRDENGKPLLQHKVYPALVMRMLEKLNPGVYGSVTAPGGSGGGVPADLMPDPEPTPDEGGPLNPIL